MHPFIRWTIWGTVVGALVYGASAYSQLVQRSQTDSARLLALEEELARLEKKTSANVRVIDRGFRRLDDPGEETPAKAGRSAPNLALVPGAVRGQGQARQPAQSPVDNDDLNGGAPKSKKPIEEIVGARLEQAFDTEPVEKGWSDRMDRELVGAVTNLGASSNVEFIECRSSVCRVESNFPSMEAYNHFMDNLAAHPGGGDGMITPQVEIAQDGSLHAVSYWIRQGAMAGFAAPATPQDG